VVHTTGESCPTTALNAAIRVGMSWNSNTRGAPHASQGGTSSAAQVGTMHQSGKPANSYLRRNHEVNRTRENVSVSVRGEEVRWGVVRETGVRLELEIPT
jgi:hypothetical protein